MFLDEARLSATLTHPHVIEVYDVGTDGDAPFFAMEYVHGANVREMLRAHARRRASGQRGQRQARRCRSAHAVDHRRRRGRRAALRARAAGPGRRAARHRAPRRLAVERARLVRRRRQGLDFGIAKWAFQRTRTQEGTLKGKFAYMSPEQCRARPVDRAQRHLRAGRDPLRADDRAAAPFSGASDLDILNRIATGQAERRRRGPRRWAPTRPRCRRSCMRALAPDPDDRFPTMQALQIALESFARAVGPRGLSTVALAAFIQELFADELVAWQAPRSARASRWPSTWRRSRRCVASVDPADRTATDAFGTDAAGARAGARAALRALAAVGASSCCARSAGGVRGEALDSDADAPSGRPARAQKELRGRRRRARKGIRLPNPTAEKSLPSPASSPGGGRCRDPTATTADGARKTRRRRPRVKPAMVRQGRAGAAGQTASGPRPTADSRLGSWDPDSPVPP